MGQFINLHLPRLILIESTKLIWFWNLYLDKVIVIFMGGFNG